MIKENPADILALHSCLFLVALLSENMEAFVEEALQDAIAYWNGIWMSIDLIHFFFFLFFGSAWNLSYSFLLMSFLPVMPSL